MEGDGGAQSAAIVPFDGGGDVSALEPGAFVPEEMWLDTVNDLIAKIPVVLDDDDVVSQDARDLSILNLRRVIARRWAHLFEMKSHLPRPDWDSLCNEVTQCMAFTSVALPFAQDLSLSCGHVVRRCAYKGGLAAEEALPIDAATVMGIIVVVGSLLSAPGLPQKTLDQCVGLLAAMEEKSDLPLAWTLVPSNAGGFSVDVNDKVSSKSLKVLMQKLEIAWPRFQKKVVSMANDLPMHQVLVALLRCRSDKQLNEGHTYKRVLKRLIHWWGQAIEQSLEKQLLSQCPDMTTAARYHPFMRSSRQKGNKTLTLTLVGRFQARPGGYITTKNETTLHSLGLVSKQSKIAGRTSMEFTLRLLGKAAEFVQKNVAEGLRTLNFCLDAAMVGEESVLTIVWRMQGYQFSGATQLLPTQLLPLGASAEQSEAALASLIAALKGQLPSAAHHELKIARDTWAWKEHRVSTKNLLCSLANSLKQYLHDSWTLNSCRPNNLLAPRSVTGERFQYLKEELPKHLQDDDSERFFVYGFKTGMRFPDFYLSEDHFRLVFSADEGTEGFLAYLHMSSLGLYVVLWPDLFHRIARRVAAALANSQAKGLLKKLNKAFKFSRGPFNTSKNGSTLQQGRTALIQALKKGQAQELAEMYLAGVARDLGKDVSEFKVDDLIKTLEKKSGQVHEHSCQHNDSRWFLFWDHCCSWDSQWHLLTMLHSFCWWVEGVNPWSLKSGSADSSEGNGSEVYSLRVATWNVLADDCNQDFMRSMILTFKAVRTFVAEMDRDLQSTKGGSLKHAVAFASGRRVERLWQKTVNDSTGKNALSFLGVLDNDGPEAVDVLEFHSLLLVSHLAALADIGLYHTAIPWVVIASMDPSSLAPMLNKLKRSWEFCVHFCDALPTTDALHDMMFFTRFQPFRDICVKGEHFAFDPKRFQFSAASAFRDAVRCIAGLGSNVNDCLQSSLPSELIFNDMRDTCRRAKKSDRTTPSNLHSIAAKSVSLRTKECPTVELSDADWASSLPHGAKGGVKASVLSALRSTDVSLGVSTHGLTKVKKNRNLTKPWVLTSRFAAFDLLCEAWHNCTGNLEEKSTKVHDLGKAMWICKLFQPHIFIRVAGMAGENNDETETRLLIMSAGPNAIKALRLKHHAPDDCFILTSKSMALGCATFLVEKIDDVQVALVETCTSRDDIAWKQSGDWMEVPHYVASHRICSMPCNLLTALLRAMKIPGYSKLTHRLKAELLLKHLGWTAEAIEEALVNLKVRTRKKQAENEMEEEQQEKQDSDAESDLSDRVLDEDDLPEALEAMADSEKKQVKRMPLMMLTRLVENLHRPKGMWWFQIWRWRLRTEWTVHTRLQFIVVRFVTLNLYPRAAVQTLDTQSVLAHLSS